MTTFANGLKMVLTKVVVGLTLLVFAGIVDSQVIITPPTDVSEKIGGSAIFTCELTFGSVEEMKWEFNGKVIYSMYFGLEDYPYKGINYKVKRDSGNFTLEVLELTFADGGVYTCINFEPSASATLVVLGTPVITSEPPIPVDGEIVVLTCEAEFGGPNKDLTESGHYPQIRMFIEDVYLEPPSSDAKIKPIESHYLMSKAHTVKANASMDQKKLICEISTVLPTMNVTSDIFLRVLYPVENVSYVPVSDVYGVGIILTCLAYGNPKPVFKWENIAMPGILIKNKMLNITIGGPNEWKCIAENSIRGNLHTKSVVATFTAVSKAHADEINQPKNNFVTSTYILIVCAIVLLLAMIFGILAIVWRKKCGTDNEMTGHESAGENAKQPLLRTMSEVKNAVNKVAKKNQLMYLIQLMCDAMEYYDVFFKEQEETLNLIRKVADQDVTSQALSQCLKKLISQSKYVSKKDLSFDWTNAFISTLTHLLEKGADPQWQPNVALDARREERWSAQLLFFGVIPQILMHKNEHAQSVNKLASTFLRNEYVISDNQRTVLHALVGLHWKWFNGNIESLPVQFFQQYKEIISKVKANETSLINTKDEHGRTPLHVFVESIQLQKNVLEDVKDIILLLKSEANIDMTDNKEQTVLHYIAAAFPICDKKILEGKHVIIELVQQLKSDKNICDQDKKGATVLHILAEKFPMKISKQGIQTYLEVMQHLASHCRKDIQDYKGHTVLHIILDNYGENAPDHCRDKLFELVSILKSASSINAKNHQGHNVQKIIEEKMLLYPALRKELLFVKSITTTKNMLDPNNLPYMRSVSEPVPRV